MSINPGRVEALYAECLAENLVETDPRYVITEGILNPTAFSAEKLEAHREEVTEMLSWLPLAFRDDATAGGGGGWSFLNACEDREGNQWTGFHRTMDRLFQLGMGLGIARYLMGRDMWQAFPGGMPYVSVSV